MLSDKIVHKKFGNLLKLSRYSCPETKVSMTYLVWRVQSLTNREGSGDPYMNHGEVCYGADNQTSNWYCIWNSCPCEFHFMWNYCGSVLQNQNKFHTQVSPNNPN